MVELRNCDRDCLAINPKILIIWLFMEKNSNPRLAGSIPLVLSPLLTITFYLLLHTSDSQSTFRNVSFDTSPEIAYAVKVPQQCKGLPQMELLWAFH
jgi:hypothetical protein